MTDVVEANQERPQSQHPVSILKTSKGAQEIEIIDVEQNSKKNMYKYIYDNKNDYRRVPIIIRLVNLLIHKTYEVDPMRSRGHNLLNVLTKISKLSSIMRSYFLINAMVGRLLDQFYGDL